MKPLQLLSLQSFTFLSTEYSVSLMIMEKKQMILVKEMVSAPTCKGILKIFLH